MSRPPDRAVGAAAGGDPTKRRLLIAGAVVAALGLAYLVVSKVSSKPGGAASNPWDDVELADAGRPAAGPSKPPPPDPVETAPGEIPSAPANEPPAPPAASTSTAPPVKEGPRSGASGVPATATPPAPKDPPAAPEAG